MHRLHHLVGRRAAIKGAAIAFSAGMLGSLSASEPAHSDAPYTALKGDIWAHEYWGQKQDIPLWIFRKRLGAPNTADQSRPVVFFVHGSMVTSRVFDLHGVGLTDYSVMDDFARHGFDCWTMDHENYGRSGRTSGNSDIASGAQDLRVAADLIMRETGQKKIHLVGESAGALRAAVFAMEFPDRVDRMVLAAFTYKGTGSPTLAKRAEDVEYFRSHNRRKRDRAMIRSIVTRDKPGTSDPAVIEALADVEMEFGDEYPTGTYLDMSVNLPVVHPEKLLVPVLIARGEFDGIAAISDIEEFYNLLPNGDRQIVTLPSTAHSVTLAINRHLFWHVTRSFLSMPARIAL